MRTLALGIFICATGCAPAAVNDTYPVSVEFPPGGIHIFLQSQHSDRPEICIDSNTDRHIELWCDRGTRRFDRPPVFSLAAGQDGLGGIPKNVHLGNGHFMSAQLELSLATPFFFVRGDAEPLILAQPASTGPTSDWAYHLADQSLWYSVSRDDTPACVDAAVIFRSADGSEKRACIDSWRELTLHPELPFAMKFVADGVRMYRLDPEAGTVTELGDVSIPDAKGRPIFDMHRPVLYVQSTDHAWVEVMIGKNDSLTSAPSVLGKRLYNLAAVEDSSLEGGDTLLWGSDRGGVAILMKEGSPVAQYSEPEASNPYFIQAGHELYVAWQTERDGKQFANLKKVTPEPIE